MSGRREILAVVEATNVTGPLKNLLEFGGWLQAEDQPFRLRLATFVRGTPAEAVLAAAANSGIPLELVPEKGPFDRSVIRQLQRLIQTHRPAVVQTHALKGHFLARLGGLGRTQPWIAFHHGYTTTTPQLRLYNQLDRISLPGAARVVTVSEAFARQLRQERGLSGDRLDVVHNAIGTGWNRQIQEAAGQAAALRQQYGLTPESVVLLIVGRLSQEKAHVDLVRALAGLRAGGRHDVWLVIVGDGPERAAIQSAMEAGGVRDRVVLAGHQKQTAPYYALAQVAVLSSLTEGSPNALLEAMAAGLPVVATAVGGIPEIVTDHESALLVPPRDVAAMQAALTRVLSDRALGERLAQAARHRIETRHTVDARGNRLMEIYHETLKNFAVAKDR